MSVLPVLIWTSASDFQSRLGERLEGDYELIATRTFEETRAQLERGRPAILFVGPEDLAQYGEDLTQTSYRLYPDLPVALIESTSSANCFWLLQMYGLSAAIPRSLSFSRRHLKVFFDHLTTPLPGFSIEPYFPQGQNITRRRVTDLSMRDEILNDLISSFAGCPYVSSHDLQLIFEEIFNNVVFHAFRTRSTEARNAGEALDEPLKPDEEVFLEWTTGEEAGALAITDNQGLLSRQDVWDRFFRQTSLTGLLDIDGRGLFLAHLLSRQVVVTIAPGRRTQIAVFFSPDPPENEKLISVRVV